MKKGKEKKEKVNAEEEGKGKSRPRKVEGYVEYTERDIEGAEVEDGGREREEEITIVT